MVGGAKVLNHYGRDEMAEVNRAIAMAIETLTAWGYRQEKQFCEKLLAQIAAVSRANEGDDFEDAWFVMCVLKASGWANGDPWRAACEYLEYEQDREARAALDRAAHRILRQYAADHTAFRDMSMRPFNLFLAPLSGGLSLFFPD